MEAVVKKNKTRREIDRSPFLKGERKMIERAHKKLIAARKKKSALRSSPAVMYAVEPGVGVAEKTALVNRWDETKLRQLAARIERERPASMDHAD